MIEYRFADPSHRADIIDFINYVFSQSARPHDFKTLIPKVYQDGRGYADIHAIVLEDQRIRGVVGQLPICCTYAGVPLKIGYIGSVSTYKYTRGSGYMKKMMAMQAEHAVETGIDIMLLGGQRQRYEYYGFSPCGNQYSYSIGEANIRHGLKNVVPAGVNWKRFQDASQEEIDSAYEIYLKQPVTGARSREDFDIAMRSWYFEPYVILDGHTVVGYVDASGKESFAELVLTDASFAPRFIKAWCNVYGQNKLGISVPDYDQALNREIARFAEHYSHSVSTQARIVNLKNVLKACLALKQATSSLSDGSIVLQMEDEKPVCAKVENGVIDVFETDKTPDVQLDRLSMQQLIFASNRYMAPEVSLPVDWFPLPIFLYAADHF